MRTTSWCLTAASGAPSDKTWCGKAFAPTAHVTSCRDTGAARSVRDRCRKKKGVELSKTPSDEVSEESSAVGTALVTW